jgi:large exoprotein involved in heme utilization and adhesion
MYGQGNAGNVTIDAGNLSLTNGALVSSNTYGKGNAGNVTIKAKDTVSLANFATAISSNVERGGVGQGGNIEIEAGYLSIKDDAQLQAFTQNASDTQPAGQGNAGNINVKVSGAVDLAGTGKESSSGIRSSIGTGVTGNGGNITIDAGNLSLTNGALVTSSMYGQGKAGNVTVKAKEAVSLAGFATAISSNVERRGVGQGGKIEIEAGYLSLKDGAQLQTFTREASTTLPAGQGNAGNINVKVSGAVDLAGTGKGFPSGILSYIGTGATGNGGNITIDAGNLSLTNGALVSSTMYGKGDGGKITIIATGNVSFDGTKDGLRSGASSAVARGGEGKGGEIEIVTGNLSVTNGALLTAGTFGKGDAGNIKITATGNVSFDDRKDGYSSGAFSEVGNEAEGKAGGIEIVTGNLSVTNGARLVASTYGKGDAGKIKITATGNGNVSFDGNKDGLLSGAFSEVYFGAEGKGGGIEIVTPNLSITNGAALATNTFGTGNAGDIFLKSNTITLNKGKVLSKSTSSTGGDINIITTDYLLMQNDSLIATDSESTGKNGNGGNITISSPLIIALPGNNDITANANQGNGGKVNITSQGLFGIQYRPKGTDFTNDITASSTFGQSGSVQINTPGIDPAKDTGELPAAPNDASNQISQACGASQRDNTFYITGRGGLPPNAREPQESDALWEDARAVKVTPATTATLPPKYAPPAIGWVFEKNGRVRLIAAQTAGEATGTRVMCPVSSNK